MKKIFKIIRSSMVCLMLIGQVVPVSAQDLNIDTLPAQSMLLLNQSNGQILYQKNSEELVDVGPAIKLLLAYLVLEQVAQGKLSLNDVVPISNAAYQLSQNYEIANVPLRQDFEYTVEELLTLVAMKNANGAALALGEKIAFSSEKLLTMMEEQLVEWQVTDFKITDSIGIQFSDFASETNSTKNKQNNLSVSALAVIAYRLLTDFPEYTNYTSIKKLILKEKSSDPVLVENVNPMVVNNIANVNGLFVGYTESLGYSYILTYQNGEHFYVAVTTGIDETADMPAYSSEQLLKFAQTNFEQRVLVAKNELTTEIPMILVEGGKKSSVASVYEQTIVLSVPKGDNHTKVLYDFTPNEEKLTDEDALLAPINKGDLLGTLQVGLEDFSVEYIATSPESVVDVIANEPVEASSAIGKFFQKVVRIFEQAIEQVRKFFTKIFN